MRVFKLFSQLFPALAVASAVGMTAGPASAGDWPWGAKVSGSGNIKTEARTVSGFTGISLSLPA